MRAVLWLMYALKVNVLNIIVQNSRSFSISLQYILSPVFEACASTSEPDYLFADNSFDFSNLTDVPVI